MFLKVNRVSLHTKLTLRIVMKFFHPVLLLVTVVLFSCTSTKDKDDTRFHEYDRLIGAAAWYQNAPEMTALYYQGFNLAQMRLDEALAADTKAKPLAVVVDIDETMLDNSPFETTLIQKGETSDGWNEWTAKAAAKALPGALEFAKYAQEKKVDIFYVTNRDSSEKTATIKNLADLGFPNATPDHVFTRDDTAFSTGNTSSKEGRRLKISATHEIVMLIGDNLNDFSEVFEDRTVNNGKEAVLKNRDLFGRKFIILPNPMYGAWEKPVYDFKKDLSNAEKTELMRSKLK